MVDIKNFVLDFLFLISIGCNLFTAGVFLNKKLLAKKSNRYLLFRSLADTALSCIGLCPRVIFLFETFYDSTALIDLSHIVCSLIYYFIDNLTVFSILMTFVYSIDQIYAILFAKLSRTQLSKSWLRKYPLLISSLSLVAISIVHLHSLYLVQLIFDQELNECMLATLEGDNVIINSLVQTVPCLLALIGMHITLWCIFLQRPKCIFKRLLNAQKEEEDSHQTELASPTDNNLVETTVSTNSSIASRPNSNSLPVTRSAASRPPFRVSLPLPLFLMLIMLNILNFFEFIPSVIHVYDAYIFTRFSEYVTAEDWRYSLNAISNSCLSLYVLVYAAFDGDFRQAASDLICKIVEILTCKNGLVWERTRYVANSTSRAQILFEEDDTLNTIRINPNHQSSNST